MQKLSKNKKELIENLKSMYFEKHARHAMKLAEIIETYESSKHRLIDRVKLGMHPSVDPKYIDSIHLYGVAGSYFLKAGMGLEAAKAYEKAGNKAMEGSSGFEKKIYQSFVAASELRKAAQIYKKLELADKQESCLRSARECLWRCGANAKMVAHFLNSDAFSQPLLDHV